MIKYLVFLVILQLSIITCLAQGDSASLKNSFIDTYKSNREFSYTSPKGEIGGPTKFVLTGRVTTSYFLYADRRVPVAFALVPDFTVKVLDQKSAAVRTPSLKLGGILYYRFGVTQYKYKYTSLKFMHHSNGQDGEATNSDGSINTYNGNFSTNYLVLSYHFGNLIPGGHHGLSLNHEAGLQWHKWFDYEKALANDYGFTRVSYNFSLRKQLENRENWRLNVVVSYAINDMAAYKIVDIKKRLNSEISTHYSLPFMHKAYLMAAAGYYGEDPYNIYYRDKYSYLRFGVSTNL
ncbi:MAG: hypothetical protein V4687_02290 [Bacteroidota bacterium]